MQAHPTAATGCAVGGATGYTHWSYYKIIKTHKLVERPPHLVEVYRTVKVDSYHYN